MEPTFWEKYYKGSKTRGAVLSDLNLLTKKYCETFNWERSYCKLENKQC